MRAFIKKNFVTIIFVILGLVGGFLYWKYVGCSSGSCPITSKWHYSTLYGAIIGYLASGLFKKTDSQVADK